jgi:ribonuclease BN (tRNA processing enzyme)
MKARFVGTGSGQSLKLRENNLMLYRTKPEDGFWMIDCGLCNICYLNDMENETGVSLLEKLQGLIITHVHIDHVGGLYNLAPKLYFNMKRKKIPLLVPDKRVKQSLIQLFYSLCSEIETSNHSPDFIDIDDCFNFIVSNEHLIGNMIVEFYNTHHVAGKSCFGIKLKLSDKTHIYTSDTQSVLPGIEYKSNDGYFWQDCQTKFRGGVHAFLDDIKAKANETSIENLYLMHLDKSPTEQEKTDAQTWCKGFVSDNMEFDLI